MRGYSTPKRKCIDIHYWITASSRAETIHTLIGLRQESIKCFHFVSMKYKLKKSLQSFNFVYFSAV